MQREGQMRCHGHAFVSHVTSTASPGRREGLALPPAEAGPATPTVEHGGAGIFGKEEEDDAVLHDAEAAH